MRLLIPIAVLVVLAGIVFVSIKIGRGLERAAAKREADRLDPQTYHEMANLLRVVFGPVQNVDDVVILPEWMKKDAKLVLGKIGTARRAIR
jgi:hypothetical protein